MTNSDSDAEYKIIMGYLGFCLIWLFTALIAGNLLVPEPVYNSWEYQVLANLPAIPVFVFGGIAGLYLCFKFMYEGIQEVRHS